MVGVAGRSGGKREGSGRKPMPPVEYDGSVDMLELLKQIALGKVEANANQVKAAASVLPYLYEKKGEGGKKEKRQQAAEGVVGDGNVFRTRTPPKLVPVK